MPCCASSTSMPARPACWRFWQASKAALGELPSLCAAAEASAVICRRAGAQAARRRRSAPIRAPPAGFGAAALDTWWTAMLRLAGNAPESLPLVCERIDILLAAGDAEVFAAFIATADCASPAMTRRSAPPSSAWKDPAARRLLEGSSGRLRLHRTGSRAEGVSPPHSGAARQVCVGFQAAPPARRGVPTLPGRWSGCPRPIAGYGARRPGCCSAPPPPMPARTSCWGAGASRSER